MHGIPPPGPPQAPAREARIDSWSSYWRQGALHSCAGSFSGNYAGPLSDFWRARFAALPSHARVLDACCGNAPLSHLLATSPAFAGSAIRIDAVDLAEVDPPWLRGLSQTLASRIRIHAGVDAAMLPFDAGSFDLCMSQYGVEYVGVAAAAELRRVLAPGGCMAAVLHHAEGLPARIAREEIEHARWLDEVGLVRLAEQLIPAMARAGSEEGRRALRADADANDRRARFNGGLQRLEERVQGARFPDLLVETRDALMAILGQARQEGERAARQRLQAWQREFERALLRQRELVEHALDEQGLRAWLAPLSGLQVQTGVLLFRPGEIAGWSLVARDAG